jgi:hypothetical protein
MLFKENSIPIGFTTHGRVHLLDRLSAMPSDEDPTSFGIFRHQFILE